MSEVHAENIVERVSRIIAEQLSYPLVEIRPGGSLARDYGADSLDQVEIVLAIEDEFGFYIGDEAAWKLDTVQQFIDAVRNRNW